MKTKEDILKMTPREIDEYKWSDDSDIKSNNNCFNCFNCSNCSHCYNCRNVIGFKYAICNVEMTKEEYENKMKEINIKPDGFRLL